MSYKITVNIECPYKNLSEQDKALKCKFLGKKYRLADKRINPDFKCPSVKDWCCWCLNDAHTDIKKLKKQHFCSIKITKHKT
jgi:hypothetical protein